MIPSGHFKVLGLRFSKSNLLCYSLEVKKVIKPYSIISTSTIEDVNFNFFPQNKQASWSLLENTNIQGRWLTSFRGGLGMFHRIYGFWIGNKITIFISLWNSRSPPRNDTSGHPSGVRKESMKRKQKGSKPVTATGWQFTFANKKVKTHPQTLNDQM